MLELMDAHVYFIDKWDGMIAVVSTFLLPSHGWLLLQRETSL